MELAGRTRTGNGPVTEFRTVWHDGFGRSDRRNHVGVSAPSEAQASWSSGGGAQAPHPVRKRWFPGRFGEPALRRREAGRLNAEVRKGTRHPGDFRRGAPTAAKAVVGVVAFSTKFLFCTPIYAFRVRLETRRQGYVRSRPDSVP